VVESFWAVIGLIVVWGLLFAATLPIRQAYLNGLIPSRQRATILSFDSMMSSTGGVWTQPLLGRAADVWGYAPSYLMGRDLGPGAALPRPVQAAERPAGHPRPRGRAGRPPARLILLQFPHRKARDAHRRRTPLHPRDSLANLHPLYDPVLALAVRERRFRV
jgi:MFS family permease